ncbi:MAG: hypothetical protein K6F56_04580 [Oscillospiraceae bacterium]|nr:hypothetical protein [Oscillospiraceae bacterium]
MRRHDNTRAVKLLCLLLALALCTLAVGCGRQESTPAPTAQPSGGGGSMPSETLTIGGQEVAVDTTSLTAVLSDGETGLLDRLPALRTADLSGSENVKEIAAWAAMHPGVDVLYTVRLPDGSVLDSDTENADLSSLTGEELEAAADALSLLPALRRVDLGAERPDMSWDSIAALRAAFPTLLISYDFDLYGTEADLENTTINLYHVPIDGDDGVFLEQVMDLMPQLKSVDLDSCDLPMWRCEEINLKYPDVKVVFRVWFGSDYSVRTDVQKILASKPSVGGMLYNDNVEGLYYCHDVMFLDIGHNDQLTDIGFVAEMPKLEVAVLAMCNWSDATPLASCPNLEYLEMQTTLCDDLTPLSGLTNLRHLNICSIGADQEGGQLRRLTDITPLYSLTGLERLWVGGFNDVPHEQIEEMRRRAPQCEINDSVLDPTSGRWRFIDYDAINYMTRFPTDYHPRYVKLIEQFNGELSASITDKAYAFSRNDPLYY